MIYTHDEAADIVDAFESLLELHNVGLPSPEDDEREPENMIGLYGSTYSDLLDCVEAKLCAVLDRCRQGEQITEGVFSGCA